MVIFLILFRTPQNLDFAIPSITFWCSWSPKTSHFELHFLSFFRSHFGNPFERAFWPVLAPQGADLASQCRFCSLFGTPLGLQIDPWRRQRRPEGSQKAGSKVEGGHPGAALDATCTPKGSVKPFWSIWGAPLGDLRLDFRRILGLKHPRVPTCMKFPLNIGVVQAVWRGTMFDGLKLS